MRTENEIITRWLSKPASQRTEEVASLSHETHRIPDPYLFLVINGLLLSPSNSMPVERIVSQHGAVEEKEYEALQKIQAWASCNENGTALWFSPPAEADHLRPNLKIVISEIMHSSERGKILFNRALVLDVDGQTALTIANHFSGDIIWDAEELRANPRFLTSSERQIWLEILSRYTSQTRYIFESEDLRLKEATLRKASGVTTLKQAQRRGLIGQYPDSCGAFSYFFTHAESSYPCPKCGRGIPKGQGITVCPHCGARKEDYSHCD